jgi:hypothetical protein
VYVRSCGEQSALSEFGGVSGQSAPNRDATRLLDRESPVTIGEVALATGIVIEPDVRRTDLFQEPETILRQIEEVILSISRIFQPNDHLKMEMIRSGLGAETGEVCMAG